ncbi:LAGLIDADG family homing endonuclease [Halosegnis longus]|uniref:DNA helicase n=1 Tax=Halosegnis longus TaxID=2216012 RepID=A0AAJ4RA61_9EURY|nr:MULTISPECIES: LAGLIDADG family homing endonuclease [Halobacteriales]RNJ27333.1 helix-turn-helix domain-containing protein [Salella cibi]
MARAENAEIIDRFDEFYRSYYRNEIGELAQKYPNEQKSLYVDWNDLYRFDPDIADDFIAQPQQMREYAEEALRLYDLPVDVKLGSAHVRVQNLSDKTGIREIRADHVGNLVSVQGIVRKATDVRPKMQQAAFECQRCGTMTRIPQSDGDFQEPHECQGCERQGPFQINFDQSEFIDSQKIRVQESPEGLRGGETPQAIDVNIEDDITGRVTAGDHVTISGILRLEQQGNQQEKSAIFDFYMEGMSVAIEDEQFEEMDISEEDKKEIIELSNDPDIYEQMVGSMAPSIFGYPDEKLAIILQLFSGVKKSLPDGSRIRGDLHMLLIGDPGTGKCVSGDTRVTLGDGSEVKIRELVESNLDDPKPVDDGVYDTVDFAVPSMADDGTIQPRRASKVWKREAPDHLYRVETRTGRELTITPSHPLFVSRDGGTNAVVADDIDAGEFIAVPRSLSTTGDDTLDVSVRRSAANNAVRLDVPDELTPWLARLLGFIIAEGYVQRHDGGSGTTYVTNNDREILDDVTAGFERLGLNPTERTSHEGNQANEIVCSSSEFVSFLDSLEPAMLEDSGHQRVPDCLYRATNPTKRGFIRAVVDAEGTVSPKQRSVVVSSTSRDLLDGLRTLLLAFGIESQLREKAGGSFRLRISGEDFERYCEDVGFVTERKATAAAEVAGSDSNTNRDVIPNVGDTLRTLREGLGLTQTECGLPRSTYQHYERGDRNPSRESLRTVVETFTEAADARAVAADGGLDVERTLASLRALVAGDISWDRISRIESVEPDDEWVYDLEIEGTHNYLTNGVVSHNSQLLQYVKKLAPRSVYTSGKGSSSAGLTAAAVRDDFGEGQQWTLEAGALVLADQGIAAVDELDKMRPEDRSAMHEALEQQSYHPDTEVLFADGRRVEIGEFVDSEMAARSDEVVDGVDCEILPVDDTRIHSVDFETNEVRKEPIDRVSRHEAPDEFVRVTFSNGRDVLVTPEHPMFADVDGDVGTVEARNIEEGAFVPAPRKLPNSAAGVELDEEPHRGTERDVSLPDELSCDLAEILGFLTAEGHSYAGSAHEIGFSNQDERLLARMDDLMTREFGFQSTDTTNDAGTVTKRWVSTKLYRWFEQNFPEFMHTAREKRIPARVLGASEEHIRRFLVGAFAGDGGVESEAMSFSTASDGLAEDYADALAKVGVASRIHHDTAEDAWKVYVMGDSTERFVDAVVEPADDRYDDARTFANRSEATSRHHDVLPTSAVRELRELRTLVGLGKTGQFRPHIDEGFGIQIETVDTQLSTVRDRIKTVRAAVADADDLASVRAAVDWSGRQLGERIDETTSRIHYAEDGGYDVEVREQLTERARTAVLAAMDEAERRVDALDARTDIRYYRVTDVETVPNEGEYATDWVYDVTVEPTNTFVSQGVALHNSISISKAGINATLKSRCSLLGAANPKYGRFDEYEPIPEQIDLEPALVSRFDLIFTVTDKPNPEKDRDLADHIINTNYAGELFTHRESVPTSNISEEEVESVTEDVEPEIDAELLRKYIAYAKRTCFPTMTEEAKAEIRDFYVDLRSKGASEDAPVPVTARKLEALVRLAEASARVRLSDTVEKRDAEKVVGIVRDSLEAIGVDPETGEFDVDMVEAGSSKSQRDRIKNIKGIINELEEEYEDGAPIEEVYEKADAVGMDRDKAEHEIEKLRRQGDIYEPTTDHLRTV